MTAGETVQLMWANQYVGIQFEPNGRERPRLDCWGLYRLVLLEQLGIELPLWSIVNADDLRAVFRVIGDERTNEQWHHVEERDVQDLDLVLMRGFFGGGDKPLHSGPLHVGCYVHPWRVLHIERRCNSVLTRFQNMRPRILGLYRHEAAQ